MPKKPISRHILKQYVAKNMRENGYSLQEIGDTIGLTRERVRQILQKKLLTQKINYARMDRDTRSGSAQPDEPEK